MNTESLEPPVALDKFAGDMGITTVTVRRWAAAGRLRMVNISGRQYIPAASVREFNRRAEAGEFAKMARVPRGRIAKRRP